MSERVTVHGNIGRSATTNLLDESIDPYQSIGCTFRSVTGTVISPRAPLDLLAANWPCPPGILCRISTSTVASGTLCRFACPSRPLHTRRYVMKTDQIDVVAFTVFR